jgi:hypothetical protein
MVYIQIDTEETRDGCAQVQQFCRICCIGAHLKDTDQGRLVRPALHGDQAEDLKLSQGSAIAICPPWVRC